MNNDSDIFPPSFPVDPNPAPSADANSLGESDLRGARSNAVGAAAGAIWGSVLWLWENPYAMTHGRPARFAHDCDSPLPLAQFEEWPEVWQAAVALGLRKPGMQHQDVALAVTNLLLEHYSDEEMRRLPLSDVVVFLRDRSEKGIRTEPGDPPASKGDQGGTGGAANAAGDEPGGAVGRCGTTAEEQVSHCLAEDSSASVQDVAARTGLTVWGVRRTGAWKDRDEAVLAVYLRNHPNATIRNAAAAMDCAGATINGKRAWQAHQAKKEAAKPPRRVKERPLSRKILECRADDGVTDPTAAPEAQDEIFRELFEGADPNTRGRLNRLSSIDREALLDELVKSGCADLHGRNPEERRDILVEAALSWLESQEQDRRRQTRKKGGRPD